MEQIKIARFPDMTFEQSELLTKLCNATHTACCAGGHNKAFRNEMVAAKYREELERQGITIPDRRELIELGVFNGTGSV